MKKSSLTLLSAFRKLDQLYDPPPCFLNHKNSLELLVAVILSAQCTDVRVNIVTKELFKKYKRVEDYAGVSQRELEKDIRSTGYYRAKARNIRALCRILIDQHHGQVPQTMEELLALPGVGRKTAAIILQVAFRKTEGIAVDTHVARLAQRLGFSKSKDPKKIELDLMKQLPRRHWGRLNPLLISHGRAVCTARNRKCDQCVFAKECPSSGVMGRGDKAAR